MSENTSSNHNKNRKQQQLDEFRVRNAGKPMTSNVSRKISDDERILTAGKRGPGLMEDVHFFEKITSFVREEIPERKVHARGYGAHGEFECYKSMKQFTKAGFLQEAGKKTPLFVRFSTVQGSKGSKDTARDLRCLGIKFYTDEGNYDMTLISFPVLINQDAMKFLDVIHAYQPEPRTGMPQASGAHDTFWDYVANNPEALHMTLWVMSDWGLIRSYRMMPSFSVNTYLFVNEEGVATFVRFIWKPVLGSHSLLMDEAQKIGGIDPDFHRRDLREAINMGAYPEYELGVQMIPMEDEHKYDFDILDSTKFWPEELIPAEIIGKMTLNRNVDNEFAELEQAAFNPGNIVPGIDFSNDPVLQGRLLAYRSAQYHRLGSKNYDQLPINRPLCPFHNNQRKGYMQYRIDVDETSYHRNSLTNNTPYTTPPEEGGYKHYPTKVEGHVTREVPEKFYDYFTQPRIFWNSLTPIEKQHMIEALSYQIGSCKSESVRQQNVDLLVNVDKEMATIVADNIGVNRPTGDHVPVSTSYPSLSQASTPKYAYSLKVGVLVGDGFNGSEVTNTLNTLKKYGVFVVIVGATLGTVTGDDGTKLKVDETFLTTSPYLLDSIYVVGGSAKNMERFNSDIMNYINVAYKHYKPIGVGSNGQSHIHATDRNNLAGVVFAKDNPNFGEDFVAAIGQMRFWDRK
ncbi:catalase [Sporosarcina pasteurii]|uniref:Catalase n=1 Tax=Sporosarcina pasteurii TaxID=1474 RepID=A0A380CER0_SPOPA|nr:catalase [Sporosarcina pasteurii]MDS9473188.1 catalase [Sporosarcina pasteurii]QBQ06921.1 catalase [Sporosarcina pasteurii]SUJ19039.1 Catalase HPII [Sporosarcina pasteurii]